MNWTLDDLPPAMRKQALEQITAQDRAAAKGAHNKQRASDESMAEIKTAPIDTRVDIQYTSIRNRPVDADASFTKWFTDGLVAAGVLVDDNAKCIRKISTEEKSGKENELVIEIWET